MPLESHHRDCAIDFFFSCIHFLRGTLSSFTLTISHHVRRIGRRLMLMIYTISFIFVVPSCNFFSLDLAEGVVVRTVLNLLSST